MVVVSATGGAVGLGVVTTSTGLGVGGLVAAGTTGTVVAGVVSGDCQLGDVFVTFDDASKDMDNDDTDANVDSPV